MIPLLSRSGVLSTAASEYLPPFTNWGMTRASTISERLYTAMHSFSDCTVGIFLAAFLWLAHTSFPGVQFSLPLPSAPHRLPPPPRILHLHPDPFRVGHAPQCLGPADTPLTPCPSTLILLTLLAVNHHPQPT
ncbi:hypothetical protein B0H14DRAFT_3446328 [Mycena olivaceomarginata]|nr:hypothetical protein B0H14DRAFT_3446328 [Mycena olivaceomarginata]